MADGEGAGADWPSGAGAAGPEWPLEVGGAGPERPLGAGGAGPEDARLPADEGGAGPSADDEHARMAAALDGIEAALDEVAAVVARMA